MESQSQKNSFVFELFEDMQRNNLNYIYRGLFTQSITDNILLLTETCLNNIGEDQKIKKRIFTILVEGLQNVTRHQEIDGKEATLNQAGIFIIQTQGDRYYITTGNPILKENIPTLTRQLEKINGLDPDALKDFYKEVLNDNIISNKGGAGLGLIEMARKSGNKLDYDFSDINGNYSYFYMGTKVMFDGKAIDEGQKHSMEAIKKVHKTINEQNIVLIYNGLHTQDSLIHILSIMEEHLMGKDLNFRKRMVYCIIEMLQNIVKHGIKSDEDTSTKGIFFISHNGSSYQLNTVNYIHNDKIENTRNAIEHLNAMSEDELNEFYDNSLSNNLTDNRKIGGLGLAGMRLKTHQKLNLSFSPIDELTSAIFMQITI